MCREGAWVELTVEVTSVEGGTTQTARIFILRERSWKSGFFFLYIELKPANKSDKIVLMPNQR